MKKIVMLLAVFLMDMILLEFVSAHESFEIISPELYPFLLMFLTIAMTLFLFYEQHFQKAHAAWRNYYQGKVDKAFEKIEHTEPPGKTPPSLELQYQFLELVKNQIVEMRGQGMTDAAIIRKLKEHKWDPQVIFIALSRVR